MSHSHPLTCLSSSAETPISAFFPRYASLYFITCVDKKDNELITLEVIHQFVEVLDRYFGNVSAAAHMSERSFRWPRPPVAAKTLV